MFQDDPKPEAVFEDIKHGVFVVIFGQEADNGDILADYVEIFVDGGPMPPGTDGLLGAFEGILRELIQQAGGHLALDDALLADVSQEARDLLFGV